MLKREFFFLIFLFILTLLAPTWRTPAAAATPTPETETTVEIVSLYLEVDPPQAEPGQPITVRATGLTPEMAAGAETACVDLVDETGLSRAGLTPLELAEKDAAETELTLWDQLEPGTYTLTVTICGWTDAADALQASTPPGPLATLPYLVTARTGQFDRFERTLSPDGQWTAIVNTTIGSLELRDGRQVYPVFPEEGGAGRVTWSPDSRRLLVERHYRYVNLQQGGGIASSQPAEIWQIRVQPRQVTTPTLLFQASQADFEREGSQQIVFGPWSPDSRYAIFGVGILSASILADGMPLAVLDTETSAVYPVSHDTSTPAPNQDNTALLNPRYQSWAPDSSALAITAGGYRSAQVNKWLNLFDVVTGQVTTVVSSSVQIPGIVSWSPRGDLIAYAAVPAEIQEIEADLMTFDNPAIAGRRLYLLDPASGQFWRLNEADSYQDAPVWNSDGTRLYYVQRSGDDFQLMVADPLTGQTEPVSGARQPIHSNDQPEIGFYGQFEREGLLEQIPEQPQGAAATGRVVAGYGSHLPVANLPLWVAAELNTEVKQRTDTNGVFTLTGLQPGLIRVRSSNFTFELPVNTITETIQLGLLKYPLTQPPVWASWTVAPLPEPSLLLDQGQAVTFTVCQAAPAWQRPSLETQQAEVWSRPPFSNHSRGWLEGWFERPAVLYNSEDQFEQSYPEGPDLGSLTLDWRYLLGLWTDDQLRFEENNSGLLVPQSACAYDSQSLEDLLQRRQLEVWLLGYQAVRLQKLDKEAAGYQKADLCDPQDSACTERPGHHFALHVSPAPGYQIIRFPGVEDVVAIHLLDEQGQPFLTLPELPLERFQGN